MIGRSLRLRPLTSGIRTSHLRAPSARCRICPFVRYSSGTDRAPLVHAVMAKLLVYGVRVYHTSYPHHACDSLTSFYSYCASGFYSAGDSSTSSTFATCPIKFRLAVDPCPRATTVPTLVLFCPAASHIGGIVGVWLRWHFGPLLLFPI